MNELPGQLDQLTKRLDALEHRVALLEHPAESAAPAVIVEPAWFSPTIAQQSDAAPTQPDSISVFTVAGRALLGIAGAYVLRAVAASNAHAMPVVAVVAIAYAFAWLVAASRTKAGAWFASATYAATSALILAPLLWELTLRFALFPPVLIAGVLAGFAAAPVLLERGRPSAPLQWVANAAAILLALGLLAASHHVAPFIVTLIVISAIAEFALPHAEANGIRILSALAADLALWTALYIYASPAVERPLYPQLAPAVLIALPLVFFAIVVASTLRQTVVRSEAISWFAVVQTSITFLLAASALESFGGPLADTVLGVACMTLAAAGYVASLVLFAAQLRNQRVYGAWSALLLVFGCLLALPTGAAAACLSLCAVVAVAASVLLHKSLLEIHALVWLIASAIVSGLLTYLWQALAATLPCAPDWTIGLCAFCAVLCLTLLHAQQKAGALHAVVRFCYALLAAASVAALFAKSMLSLLALALPPAAHHLAFFRMVALCAVSAALAFYGAHTQRAELVRAGFAVLALAAIKLVVEDLRHGNLVYIAAAIVLLALTLIAVPRVAHLRPHA